jgi:hypothetical protein
MPDAEEFAGEAGMNCEEFATAGLDLGSPSEDSPVQRAARGHMRVCPSCAALHENWQTLRTDLHVLGSETSQVEAPAHVEMRLLQEFRIRNKTMKLRRASLVAAWSLAAAAVLLIAVSWATWRRDRIGQAAHSATGPTVIAPSNDSQAPQKTSDSADNSDSVIASNSSDFTFLPGSLPTPLEDAAVVRVQMQRGSLGALGLTVNEERAADWIQVDLLVGNDGIPQAIRMPQQTN